MVKGVLWIMLLGLVGRIIVRKGKEVMKSTENAIFVMDLIWKVANSKEFGSHSLRQFTTKLRLFSD